MKTVKIIKIAGYDPTMNGRYSLYQGYCLSTLQVSQPRITTTTRITAYDHEMAAFCSTLTRSQQTALLLGLQAEPISLLDEIRFDLRSLLNEQEFNTLGSGKVRERFLAAYTEDRLLESRVDIIKRVRALLSYLRSKPQDGIICVSHSFFMKVLEAYITTDGAIKTRPELLSNFISLKKHTYPYMEGFEFKL